MNRAFHDLFGLADAFDGIPMAGRTDRSILEDAITRAGLDRDDPRIARFSHQYSRRLLEALPEPGHRKDVLPGVRPLLDALTSRPDIFLALLTGNCEQGARIKLEHFDLWRQFRCGAYGDLARDRHELVPVAMRRARECGAPEVGPREVLVVGDTELDVACAVSAGARSVAVATGSSDSAALRQSGADVVFEDLSDTAAFIRLL
jgi:phosphoglycolate phosphatase